MKKAMRKMIPAVIMLLISAMLVGTSTYAWFSMNRTVTVTGMRVKTTAGSNLFIAADTLASTTKKADSDFGTTMDTNDQTPTFLEPVSTKTGKAFFYTTSARPNGDAVADDYVAYNAVEVPTSQENDAFANAYSQENAVGYKDYVFQLKAYNSQTTSKDIKITKLDLFYSGVINTGKAFRVAVFVEDITSANPAGGSGTLKGIYAPSGAANFSDASEDNYAIGAAGTAPSALDNDYNTVANIATVATNDDGMYKVVVRLYIEGEDTTCKNETYAALNGQWSLDIEIKIDDATTNTAVTSLGQYSVVTVETTTYYSDGTYVWTNKANLGTETGRSALASADSAVKTAFGYTAA